jgi:cell division protein FtsB
MPEGRSSARRWACIAAAVAAAAVLFGNKGFRRLVSSTLLLRRLDAEKSALDLEEKRLKEFVAAAKSDDKALERIIRKELGYHKPGEIEYRFPPPRETR